MKHLKRKKIAYKVLKLLDPVDTAKFYWAYTKRNKWISIIALLVIIMPVAFMGNNLQSLADAITGDFLTDVMKNVEVSLDSGVGTNAKILYDALIPVGQSLALLYWMIGLGEIAMRDDLSPELIMKDLAKIVFTLIVIGEYGYDLARGLLGFADSIYGSLATAMSSSTAVNVTMQGDFTNVPWTKLAVTLISLGGLFAFKLYIQVQISIIMWMRKIKIILFTGFMPVGLYDFRDGFRSASAMYLKKYFALCLQGVFILATNFIFMGLISDTFKDFFLDGGFKGLAKFIVTAIPVCLAMVTMFKVSETLTNEVLGVR